MKEQLLEAAMPRLTTIDIANTPASTERPALDWEADTVTQADAIVWHVLQLVRAGRQQAVEAYLDDVALNSEQVMQLPPLHHAWLWLVRMSAFIASNNAAMALESAESALTVLVAVTAKRNEDYMALVASLLYNLARVHHALDDNARAVKELTRAQKLLERLVKRNAARFSATMVIAVEASTTIYKNRIKQMNVFNHYQTMTELYAGMVGEGKTAEARQALGALVDSLKKEGDLILQLGNPRQAVKFYTKALRYHKKLGNTMGIKELRLSIGLAQALLRLANRRDTAQQLLTSLVPLAERLGAHAELAQIKLLQANQGRNRNIMTMLKGM